MTKFVIALLVLVAVYAAEGKIQHKIMSICRYAQWHLCMYSFSKFNGHFK